MQKPKLFPKKLIGLIVMVVGAGFLTALFIVSAGIDSKNAQKSFTRPSAEQIMEYSHSFLKDSSRAEMGKYLDCSGFSRTVFGNFGINLGASAKNQYKNCEPVLRDEINAGNLVFFITNGKEVSHVGISIDENRFIHSPGKTRYVRIDSLSEKYWDNCFVGAGKIKI